MNSQPKPFVCPLRTVQSSQSIDNNVEMLSNFGESEVEDDMENEAGSADGDSTTSNASSSDESEDDENAEMIRNHPEANALTVNMPTKERTKLFFCGFEYSNPRHKYKKGKKLMEKQIWRCVHRTTGWRSAKKEGQNSVNCPAAIHVTVDTKEPEKRYFIDKIVGLHSHSGDLRNFPVAEVRLYFPRKLCLPEE